MSEQDEALLWKSVAECLLVLKPKKGSFPGEQAFRELAQHCENYLRQHAEIERLTAERNALRQERDEDQGVIRVWRGRTERAEAERDMVVDLCDSHGLGLIARSRIRALAQKEQP